MFSPKCYYLKLGSQMIILLFNPANLTTTIFKTMLPFRITSNIYIELYGKCILFIIQLHKHLKFHKIVFYDFIILYILKKYYFLCSKNVQNIYISLKIL